MSPTPLISSVRVLGAQAERHEEILTSDALEFIRRLDSAFADRRLEVLKERSRRTAHPVSGTPLDFSRATAAVRADTDWRVAPPAPGLTDRRVEITGPPERRMAINALNSGAKVWMADFEDATAPTWNNVIGGQLNLLDAIERRIDFTTPEGKDYRLGAELATIMVRPRGWHLLEEHLEIDGRPVSASLVDFGLYFFHCAQRQIDAGHGPYFYLPKLENRTEARLWNDIFVFAQDLLGIPRGTVRATVLIETITAALEMEEVLYELREHSAGLNAGRWDYLFSLIKTFGHRTDFQLPDRAKVTMTAPFMRAYTELLVRTCHRRGAHAIGGMAVRRIAAPPTSEGVRSNVAVALRYFEARLRGRGAVGLNGLMEDAATAEIARVQIWQWLRHGRVDRSTVTDLLDAECAALEAEDPQAFVLEAREVFVDSALSVQLPLFFTPEAYTRHLVRRVPAQVNA
ncbi:malate synthase [Streptomyces sp. NBC_00158]|uniref:malate synthase n=1 Tax=Streptomyces sp. NBC_00158 TaxID=2903627 RepID=UPI0032533EEE